QAARAGRESPGVSAARRRGPGPTASAADGARQEPATERGKEKCGTRPRRRVGRRGGAQGAGPWPEIEAPYEVSGQSQGLWSSVAVAAGKRWIVALRSVSVSLTRRGEGVNGEKNRCDVL
ncbi:hypothetical protein B296_00011435, partial [Ensete ventricosum]